MKEHMQQENAELLLNDGNDVANDDDDLGVQLPTNNQSRFVLLVRTNISNASSRAVNRKRRRRNNGAIIERTFPTTTTVTKTRRKPMLNPRAIPFRKMTVTRRTTYLPVHHQLRIARRRVNRPLKPTRRMTRFASIPRMCDSLMSLYLDRRRVRLPSFCNASCAKKSSLLATLFSSTSKISITPNR